MIGSSGCHVSQASIGVRSLSLVGYIGIDNTHPAYDLRSHVLSVWYDLPTHELGEHNFLALQAILANPGTMTRQILSSVLLYNLKKVLTLLSMSYKVPN